jgi:hypothetical protein
MATWSILLSELSVNLLKNPVFGNGTTNWANTNGTLTTNTTAANLLYGTTAGAYSGTTLAANSGIYCDLDTTATAVAGQVEFWVSRARVFHRVCKGEFLRGEDDQPFVRG